MLTLASVKRGKSQSSAVLRYTQRLPPHPTTASDLSVAERRMEAPPNPSLHCQPNNQ